MDILFFIIVSTGLISLISLVGALILFLKEKLLEKLLLILVSFAAGSLIGTAFFHLLPEAIGKTGQDNILKVFSFLILGFISFFVLENFISWHHHHHVKDCKDCPRVMPFSYLILISDAVHNFIDGIIIAASFVIALPLGVITSLAVVLHERPQEMGDFGILIYGGFKKKKALFLNFFSAVTAVLGGVVGFFLFEKIGQSIVFLLPFAAGSFLYIACSDLIPEIKRRASPRKSVLYFLVFLSGIGLMWGLTILLA